MEDKYKFYTKISFPSDQKSQTISVHTRTKFLIKQDCLGILP